MTTAGCSPTVSGSAISVAATSTGSSPLPGGSAPGGSAVTSTRKLYRNSVMVLCRMQLAAQQLAGGVARQ